MSLLRLGRARGVVLAGLAVVWAAFACARQAAGTVPAAPPCGSYAQSVPEWSWKPEAAVEWSQLACDGPRPILLVATADNQVHILDGATGRPLLPRPIIAGPGVRAAPLPSDRANCPTSLAVGLDHEAVVYCFDRFSVYAIGLLPEPRLHWRAGSWPAGLIAESGALPEDLFQGDPEQLRRIVAAQALPDGLLVLRDDGRLAFLEARDAKRRWERELEPVAVARMAARGNQAVLVYKTGPRLCAVMVDVTAGSLRDVAWPRDAGLPTFAAFSGAGAVFLTSRSALLVRGSAVRTLFSLDAATILARTAELAEGAAPYLLLATSDGLARAIDLAGGGQAWAVETPGVDLAWCRCLGDLLVAAGGSLAALWEISTGGSVGKFSADAGYVLADAALTRTGIWFAQVPADSSAGDWELRLACWPRSGEALGKRWRRIAVSTRGRFINLIWAGDRVIVVTQTGLTAVNLR